MTTKLTNIHEVIAFCVKNTPSVEEVGELGAKHVNKIQKYNSELFYILTNKQCAALQKRRIVYSSLSLSYTELKQNIKYFGIFYKDCMYLQDLDTIEYDEDDELMDNDAVFKNMLRKSHCVPIIEFIYTQLMAILIYNTVLKLFIPINEILMLYLKHLVSVANIQTGGERINDIKNELLNDVITLL